MGMQTVTLNVKDREYVVVLVSKRFNYEVRHTANNRITVLFIEPESEEEEKD